MGWLRRWWMERPGRWAWPLWACAALTVAGVGFARQEDTINRLEDEVDAREAQACDVALATRVEQEQLLVDMVTQLGGEQRMVDTIHQAYDALPEPSSCEPKP